MDVDVPQVFLLGKTYLTKNENFYIRNDSIVHMAAGERHTIIVTESGRAFVFGDNHSGQLGLGHIDAVERVSCIKSLKFGETGEKIVLAACGRESSLLATNRGSLYVFGSNRCCQLGIESDEFITIQFSPIKIDYFRSEMSWKQLAMGAEHTCALTNDSQVYIWGSNEFGQCGLERKYEMISAPSELRLAYVVTAISCGYYHTALIGENGRLFLFGSNSAGQLGRSISDRCIGPLEVSLPDAVHAVACGNEHTVVLTEKGDVYTCGRGDRGQLGLGRQISITQHFQMIENLPRNLSAIAAGSTHTAILDSTGGIYLFGDGKYGQLNRRTHSNRYQPFSPDQFKGYHVSDVVCGGYQTIVFAQRKSIGEGRFSRSKDIQARVKFSDERSLSAERTISISEQILVQGDCYTSSSSTNSGCTSSSIPSLQDEYSVSTDAIEPHYHSPSNEILGKPYEIESADTTIPSTSKYGFLSRIFNGNSSRKSSLSTHESSKTCVIM